MMLRYLTIRKYFIAYESVEFNTQYSVIIKKTMHYCTASLQLLPTQSTQSNFELFNFMKECRDDSLSNKMSKYHHELQKSEVQPNCIPFPTNDIVTTIIVFQYIFVFYLFFVAPYSILYIFYLVELSKKSIMILQISRGEVTSRITFLTVLIYIRHPKTMRSNELHVVFFFCSNDPWE